MNTFGSAYRNSKKEIQEQKKYIVEQEHYELVEKIKKDYGIISFDCLNESDKQSYKTMILKFWNKETGLNDLGKKYIQTVNESTTNIETLTKDSTTEQIQKVFQKYIKTNIKDIVLGLASENHNWEDASKIKQSIEEQIGKKISTKDCKGWMYEVVNKYIIEKIRTYKFK